jgi:XrtJ-associated TM-motif-TM protein
MNKLIRMALLGMAVLSLAGPVHAQTGCLDSPENPTAVLALMGAAGSAVPWLFGSLAKRRKK